jgi:hypothetical protein
MKIRSETKTAAVALAIILGWSLQGTAQTVQYVMLESKNGQAATYSLQTNQVVQLLNDGSGNIFGAKISLNDDAGNVIYLVNTNYSSGNPTVQTVFQTAPYTGMTSVTVSNSSPSFTFCTLQITTPAQSPTVVSNYVPADAIVIPASATGNVQIILESSPDLVNWTAASPGTYGASAGTNRFFRVRAAAN